MEWKYNWLQWKYYHCDIKQSGKYLKWIQQETERVFAPKETHRVNQKPRAVSIVVSLTSIPERLSCVQYPIRCMLRQSVRPDKIVLYLDKGRLNDDMLPQDLLALKSNGLEIVYVEDLGPHTKYYYALQTYKDCYVVTIDDDQIYSRDLIRTLLKTEKMNRGAVCARRAAKMRFTQRGIPYPYRSFKHLFDEALYSGKDILALGVGGVLYPPHCLDDAEYDPEMIRKIARQNDDIWLKAQELLYGVEVVKAKGVMGRYDNPVTGSQKVALCKNNHASGNDENMKAVFTQYGLSRFFANSNWKPDAATDTLVRRLLTEWLALYQKKLSIGKYLMQRGVHSAAIYGMAKLGHMLQQELEENGIEVKYGIDVREINDAFLPMFRPEDITEPVDLIIVTAVTDLFALKRRLEPYTHCEIDMLENIIAETAWESIFSGNSADA